MTASCPYREVCPKVLEFKICPGDDVEEGEWEPTDGVVNGFQVTQVSVTCIDWGAEFPNSPELQLRIQQLILLQTSSLETGEPRKKHSIDAQLRYAKTTGGRASLSKYLLTEKG